MEEKIEITGYPNYFVTNEGKIWSAYKNIYLKPCISKSGYYNVALWNGRKIKTFQVHRLIAQEFIPNPAKKRCINHIDGNKLNNHISNLEWNTHSENSLHAFKTGLRNFTEKQREVHSERCSKLTSGNSFARVELVNTITGEFFYTIRDAANFYGLNESTLGKKLQGKSPNHTGLIYKNK